VFVRTVSCELWTQAHKHTTDTLSSLCVSIIHFYAAISITKKLLKGWRDDGSLKDVVLALVEEDPRAFLLNASDIADFRSKIC